MSNKSVSFFVMAIIAFFTAIGFADGKNQVKPIKIICIGNSITFGATSANPTKQSYPAVLQNLLKENSYENYQVENFGISSATMLHYGTPNLWQTLDSIKKELPDIVIIKAGTNETVGKPRLNWEHIADFEKDYYEFINEIRKVNPVCKIVICSPLDFSINTKGLTPERFQNLQERRPRIWQLRKRIKQIAKVQHTLFLDLTPKFKNKRDLITEGDGVHPNVKGYHYLATVVFNFLQKKKLIINNLKII